MTLQKGTADFVSVLLITIGLGYLFYYTSTFPPSMLPGYPGDAFFPRIVLGFSLFFCASIIFRRGKELFFGGSVASGEGETVTIDLVQFTYIIALVLAFIFLLPVLGFEACTFLFMFILLIARWFDKLKTRIIKVGLLSLVVSLFFYFSFVILLNVAFPVKILTNHIEFF